MIPSRYTFRTKEIQLNLPKEGTHIYSIESTSCVNYSRGISCTRKKEVSISILSDEDQPYTRLINIEVENDNFQFSDGSFAMQDIIKSIASVYSNLHVRVSYKGAIVAIHNMDELQERWKEVKEYVQSKYKGSQVDRLVFKIDHTLKTEERVIHEILLYQNFGGLLKPIYQEYNSDSCQVLLQKLSTKYGKITATEEVLLQAVKEMGDVQLQLQANHPENEEYVTINGTYNFTGQNESWLQQAVISCVEKYGRQEYHTTVNIIQL